MIIKDFYYDFQPYFIYYYYFIIIIIIIIIILIIIIIIIFYVLIYFDINNFMNLLELIYYNNYQNQYLHKHQVHISYELDHFLQFQSTLSYSIQSIDKENTHKVHKQLILVCNFRVNHALIVP